MKRILFLAFFLIVAGLFALASVYESRRQALTKHGGPEPTPKRTPSSQSPTVGSSSDPDSGSAEDLPCPQDRKQAAEARFRDYTIRAFRWPNPEGCLQITRQGAVVYSSTSAEFEIGNNFNGSHNGPDIPIGADITGAGQPDAIVSEWSGGAHCCFTMHVFELGENFRKVAQIDAGDSDGAHFSDLDRDGFFEFVGNDWTFAYWRTSFAGSPAPRIVLKYRDGQFRLAANLMKEPAPPATELASLVEGIRASDEWSTLDRENCDRNCGVPVALWKNMLDLMYSGNSDLAWQLLNKSWRGGPKSAASFVGEFCQRLTSSHYWSDLRATVGSCPP